MNAKQDPLAGEPQKTDETKPTLVNVIGGAVLVVLAWGTAGLVLLIWVMGWEPKPRDGIWEERAWMPYVFALFLMYALLITWYYLLGLRRWRSRKSRQP